MLQLLNLETVWVGVLGSRRRITFHPSGLSFIVGGNESGKTTIRRVLQAVLNGESTEPELQCWDSKEIPRVQIGLTRATLAAPVIVTADLLSGSLVVGSAVCKDAEAFRAELEKALELPGLAKHPPFLRAALELPPGMLERLQAPTAPQVARLTQERAGIKAAALSRLDEAATASKAAEAKLAAFAALGAVLDKRKDLAAARAALEAAIAARAGLEKQRDNWDEATRISDGMQTLQMMLDMLRADLERAEGLRDTLTTRYGRYDGCPEMFPQLLQQIGFERMDSARLIKAAEAAEVAAHFARDSYEEAKNTLETTYPEYLTADANFPVWLHRYQALQQTITQEREAVQGLLKRRRALDTDIEMYSHFKDATEEYQTEVSKLADVQKESAAKVALLDQELAEITAVEEEVKRLEASLQPVFAGVGVDFAERFKLLETRQEEAKRLNEELQELVGSKERAEASVASFAELFAEWPADFPQWLKTERARWTSESKEALAADAAQAEAQQIDRLSQAMREQLKSLDGLEDQEEAFGVCLEELFRSRAELASEEIAYGAFAARYDAAKAAVDAGRSRFRSAGDNFAEKVEQLRARVIELQERRAELEVVGGRRHELEGEIAAAEASIRETFGSLAAVPMEFPSRLREYHRLTGVMADLKRRQNVIQDEIQGVDELLAVLLERFDKLREALAQLESTRASDDILYRVLKRIEWELQERQRLEAVKGAAPAAAGASNTGDLQIAAQGLDAIWEAHQKLVAELDRTLTEDTASSDLMEQLEAFLRLSAEAELREQLEKALPVAAGMEKAESSPMEADMFRRAVVEQARQLNIDSPKDATLLLTELRASATRRAVAEYLKPRLAAPQSALEELRSFLQERLTGETAGDGRAVLDAEARLAVLRPKEELEETRAGLLAMVAARLSEAGLGDVTVAEYLEFQSLHATRARLVERHDGMVNRSGSGNDLERISGKLKELEALLGAENVQSPMDQTMKRYEELVVARLNVDKLKASLEELADLGALEASCQISANELQRGLERIGLKDAEELEASVPQFHEYRASVATLAALEELRRTQWHESVSADGALENDLDRHRAVVKDLEHHVGAWAEKVTDAAEVPVVVARWKLARELAAELKSLDAARAALPEGKTRPPAAPPLEAYADEDLLLWVWAQRQEADSAASRWRELRGEQTKDDGTVETASDRLAAQIAELTSQLPPLEELPSRETLFEQYEADKQARILLESAQERLLARRPREEVTADRQELKKQLTEKHKELRLDEGVALELVVQEFDEYRRILTDHKEVMSEMASREFALQNLEAEAEVLRPKLGGREGAIDADAEMERYNTYRDQREAVSAHQRDRDAAAEEAQSRRAEANDAQERLTHLETRCQDWLGDRDVAEVQAEYTERQRLKAELASLEERGTPVAEVQGLEQQIASLKQSLADLGELPPRPDDYDAQLDALKAAEKSALESADKVAFWVKEAEAACEAPVPDDLEAQTEAARSEVARLNAAMEEAEALTEKVDRLAEEEPLNRCRERGSQLLANLTKGRYLQMTREGATIWLTPARGARVQLEKTTGMQRPVELCWEMGVLGELGLDHPWPVVFDDPFRDLDAARRRVLLELLNGLAAERQVIVLTSEESIAPPDRIVADLNAAT